MDGNVSVARLPGLVANRGHRILGREVSQCNNLRGSRPVGRHSGPGLLAHRRRPGWADVYGEVLGTRQRRRTCGHFSRCTSRMPPPPALPYSGSPQVPVMCTSVLDPSGSAVPPQVPVRPNSSTLPRKHGPHEVHTARTWIITNLDIHPDGPRTDLIHPKIVSQSR